MRGLLWCFVVSCLGFHGVAEAQTSRPTTRRVKPTSRPVAKRQVPPVRRALASPCAGKTSGVIRSFTSRHIVAADGLIRVLEDGRKAIAVYKAETGKLLWRKRFQKKPLGVHSIHATKRHTVVYAGNRLFAFVTKTGYQSGSHWVAFHWHARNRDGCTFEHRQGVCALSCGPTFQLINCHTMHPMSVEYPLTQSCFSKGGGCFSFRGQPFGRLHGNWLAVVEAPKRTSLPTPNVRRNQVMVAISEKTGRISWESEDAAVVLAHSKESGQSPDGKTCWVVNYAGDARVFDCRTGAALWSMSQTRKRPLVSVFGRRFRWQAKPEGLLLYERNAVSLRHPRTGKVLWKKRLLGRTIAVVEGTAWPASTTKIKRPLSLQVLDTKQGKLRRILPIAIHQTLHVFSNQVLGLQGKKDVVVLTTRGKYRWVFPFLLTKVMQSSNYWIFQGKDILHFSKKRDKKIAFTHRGFWRVAGTEKELGKGRALVQLLGSRGQRLTTYQLLRVCLH